MTLRFVEPEVVHPNSETETIFDIARMLEAKYHICEDFVNKNLAFIRKQCIPLALLMVFDKRGELDKRKHITQEKIRAKWREFILDNGTKLITAASKERGDPSFVDTGSYYLSMRIEIDK